MGKHWTFTKNEDLVVSHLKALARLNPAIKFIPDEKVIYNPHSPQDKTIKVISGGGGGHEPMHAAYVGDNLLDAAVSGAIFASPSTKQIMAAIRKVSSKDKNHGTLIVVKNYTGDILHFGLVVERAKAEGYAIEMLPVTDDVAVGREQNKMVGRRGLAGTAIIHKILGGATSVDNKKSYDLKAIHELGLAVNNNLVTIGASLDRTSVPGKPSEEDGDLAEEEIDHNFAELGLGIHNEPGHRLSPIPNVDDLIKQMFEMLISQRDKDRHYVDFDNKIDEYVLLINNIGGTSTLELYAVAEHVISNLPLAKRPARIFISDFVTSLNAPGFSITLLNLSNITKDSQFSAEEVLAYLDAPTNAPGWKPKSYDSKLWDSADDKFEESPIKEDEEPVTSALRVDAKAFETNLVNALENLLKQEPKITEYDTKVGDGDCGETLAAGANSVLKALKDDKSFREHLNDPVATLTVITELVEESMGGTSGGLYSIFLTRLVQSLQQTEEVSVDSLAEAFRGALYDGLFKYTKARAGGRTLVDTLQPFVDALVDEKDLKAAVKAAKDGCQSTTELQAKFGRASYVDDEEFKDGDNAIPDPGAVGLLALIEGFLSKEV